MGALTILVGFGIGYFVIGEWFLGHVCGMKKAKIWNPIETVPKDGTSFLAAVQWPSGSDSVEILHWTPAHRQYEGYFVIRGDVILETGNPTHWMLLPTPPRK